MRGSTGESRLSGLFLDHDPWHATPPRSWDGPALTARLSGRPCVGEACNCSKDACVRYLDGAGQLEPRLARTCMADNGYLAVTVTLPRRGSALRPVLSRRRGRWHGFCGLLDGSSRTDPPMVARKRKSSGNGSMYSRPWAHAAGTCGAGSDSGMWLAKFETNRSTCTCTVPTAQVGGLNSPAGSEPGSCTGACRVVVFAPSHTAGRNLEIRLCGNPR